MNDYLLNIAIRLTFTTLPVVAVWVVIPWFLIRFGKKTDRFWRSMSESSFRHFTSRVKTIFWLLSMVTLFIGVFSAVNDPAVTYKHNDADNSVRSVQEGTAYLEKMSEAAKGEITLDGVMAPEEEGDREERVSKMLDWRSKLEDE